MSGSTTLRSFVYLTMELAEAWQKNIAFTAELSNMSSALSVGTVGVGGVASASTSVTVTGSLTVIDKKTMIAGDGILVRQNVNNQFMIRKGGNGKIQVSIVGLPTSDYGLDPGDIWRDGTTLRIKP